MPKSDNCRSSVIPSTVDQGSSTSANAYSGAVNRYSFYVSPTRAILLGTAMVNIYNNGVL